MPLNNAILFLITITASLTILNADYNQSLILKKESSNSIDEYSINSNDLILIKCKNKIFPDPKFLGGQFIGTKNNYIFFETKTLLGRKSLESVNLNDIEAVYAGNVRTWKDLHRKWSLYLSLLIIRGSIEMGNSPYVTDGVSKEFAAISAWSMFSMLSYLTYAPIIASIDFNKRNRNAIEFIIGPDHWSIN